MPTIATDKGSTKTTGQQAEDKVSILSGSTWQTKVTHLEQQMAEATTELTNKMDAQNKQHTEQLAQIQQLLQTLAGNATNQQGVTRGTGVVQPAVTDLDPKGRYPDSQGKTETKAGDAPQAKAREGTAPAGGP